MTILLIILLILLVIYLYYQNRKLQSSSSGNASEQVVFDSEADLIADRDLAIRQKNETEAENLALSNKLRNKQQEVSKKEQEIERLKSEKNLVEVNLQTKINELKTKYSKQAQLLDTEQTENNKLTEKIEQLQAQIKELARSASPIPNEFPELTKQHQEQLREVYALFDLRAKGMKAIDFNQLMGMLKGIKSQLKK